LGKEERGGEGRRGKERGRGGALKGEGERNQARYSDEVVSGRSIDLRWSKFASGAFAGDARKQKEGRKEEEEEGKRRKGGDKG